MPQRQSVLGVFGAIFGAMFGHGLGDMLAARPRCSTLSFSREQEYQADTLGLRYMIAAGYDPRAAPSILAALAAQTRARSAGPGPHQPPDAGMGEHPSVEREPHAARARRGPRDGPARHGHAQPRPFLAQLDGVYVDDDPAQGVIDGPSFTHPDLRIQFSGAAGLSDVERHRRGDDRRLGRARRSSAAAASTATLDNYILPRVPAADRRPGADRGAAAAADDDQRHAGGVSRPRASTRQSGVVDVSVMAYQWDSAARSIIS